MQNPDYALPPPQPGAAYAGSARWAGAKGAPATDVSATALSSPSYHRGRHARDNSQDGRLEQIQEQQVLHDDGFEWVGRPVLARSHRLDAGPPPAPSSVLRRLTNKYAPVARPKFPSFRRAQGRQYETLDADADQTGTVDISSLAGLGWEMTDISGGGPSMPHEATHYLSPSQAGASHAVQSLDREHAVGAGMKGIGVQLRRDPTTAVRGLTTGMRLLGASGIDRARTVRQLGQNLAQEKNMIVEVEEAVDLSSLAGGQGDDRSGADVETQPMRQSMHPQETKSYYFPEDPDIPNWKPASMSSPYILTLLGLALGLAGFQEFLCQRSQHEAKKQSGLLAFNQVADISTWDFFAWKYLPTMVTIVYAVLFSIMDFDIRRLEPFYQLSRPGGASAAASLNLDHLTMFQYFVPFKAFRLKQWAVLVSTTGNIIASMAAPALQNPAIVFATNPNPACNNDGCGDTGEKHYWVRVAPIWSRLLSASYVVVGVTLVVLFLQLRRKSGLLSDPKGIAGIASMATKSHILQDFAGLDEATRGQIHRKLQHRRYLLYKSSIWQGEWTASRDVVQESEQKLKSPHPMMLRMRAGVPFLVFMVFCLGAVPAITLTPARIVPNAVPWLPILVATALKLFFSTFESDVRLMEPFYQLSKGNATPENSLTLDYQATVYGWMPFKAMWNRHYLVALVGFASVSLDVLTVTVSSFSVNSEDFMHVGRDKDQSNGDETYNSFWVSLILSLAILLFVIFTTSLVYARRRHPFLPREPSTIAAVLAFIYASNMLMDFVGTERLNNKQMELRLKTLGKRYGLGWFRGRDGQTHCAIDEEPMKSKYVHGKPYTMAQAGPLPSHEPLFV